MSEGLGRIAGAYGEITLNGVKYRTTVLRLGDKAEIETHVKASRQDLLEEVASSIRRMSEENRAIFERPMIAAAVERLESRQNVSSAEFQAFLDTHDGLCFVLWMMLRTHQPELKTWEHVKPLVGDIPLEILQHKIDEASGANDLKNSDGRAAVDQVDPAILLSVLDGLQSIATSQKSSAGRPTKSIDSRSTRRGFFWGLFARKTAKP